MYPRTTRPRGEGPAPFFTPGRVALLVIAALTLLFIFGNTRETKIRLLLPEVSMPLWLALFFTGLIGVLCGRYLGRRHR